MFANLAKCGNDFCTRFVREAEKSTPGFSFDSRSFCSTECIHLYQIAQALRSAYGRVDPKVLDCIREHMEKMIAEPTAGAEVSPDSPDLVLIPPPDMSQPVDKLEKKEGKKKPEAQTAREEIKDKKPTVESSISVVEESDIAIPFEEDLRAPSAVPRSAPEVVYLPACSPLA